MKRLIDQSVLFCGQPLFPSGGDLRLNLSEECNSLIPTIVWISVCRSAPA